MFDLDFVNKITSILLVWEHAEDIKKMVLKSEWAGSVLRTDQRMCFVLRVITHISSSHD